MRTLTLATHPLGALRRPVAVRALVGLLVLALWLAATLGLVHRTVHSPDGALGPGASVVTVAPSKSAAHEAHPHAHGPLSGWLALFDGHTDGSEDCRLIDQLSHGGPVPAVGALVLPLVLPTALFAFMQGEVLARWVLLFDARGPPAAR